MNCVFYMFDFLLCVFVCWDMWLYDITDVAYNVRLRLCASTVLTWFVTIIVSYGHMTCRAHMIQYIINVRHRCGCHYDICYFMRLCCHAIR